MSKGALKRSREPALASVIVAPNEEKAEVEQPVPNEQSNARRKNYVNLTEDDKISGNLSKKQRKKLRERKRLREAESIIAMNRERMLEREHKQAQRGGQLLGPFQFQCKHRIPLDSCSQCLSLPDIDIFPVDTEGEVVVPEVVGGVNSGGENEAEAEGDEGDAEGDEDDPEGGEDDAKEAEAKKKAALEAAENERIAALKVAQKEKQQQIVAALREQAEVKARREQAEVKARGEQAEVRGRGEREGVSDKAEYEKLLLKAEVARRQYQASESSSTHAHNALPPPPVKVEDESVKDLVRNFYLLYQGKMKQGHLVASTDTIGKGSNFMQRWIDLAVRSVNETMHKSVKRHSSVLTTGQATPNYLNYRDPNQAFQPESLKDCDSGDTNLEACIQEQNVRFTDETARARLVCEREQDAARRLLHHYLIYHSLHPYRIQVDGKAKDVYIFDESLRKDLRQRFQKRDEFMGNSSEHEKKIGGPNGLRFHEVTLLVYSRLPEDYSIYRATLDYVMLTRKPDDNLLTWINEVMRLEKSMSAGTDSKFFMWSPLMFEEKLFSQTGSREVEELSSRMGPTSDGRHFNGKAKDLKSLRELLVGTSEPSHDQMNFWKTRRPTRSEHENFTKNMGVNAIKRGQEQDDSIEDGEQPPKRRKGSDAVKQGKGGESGGGKPKLSGRPAASGRPDSDKGQSPQLEHPVKVANCTACEELTKFTAPYRSKEATKKLETIRFPLKKYRSDNHATDNCTFRGKVEKIKALYTEKIEQAGLSPPTRQKSDHTKKGAPANKNGKQNAAGKDDGPKLNARKKDEPDNVEAGMTEGKK